MLQWIVVLVVAYLAYHFLGDNWLAAAGVIVISALAMYLYRSSRERSDRVKAALIVSMPLSAAEKIHMETIAERNQRLAQRQAGKR